MRVSLVAPIKEYETIRTLLDRHRWLILIGEIMTFIVIVSVYILLLVLVLAPLMLSSRISRCMKEDEVSFRSKKLDTRGDASLAESFHKIDMHSEVAC